MQLDGIASGLARIESAVHRSPLSALTMSLCLGLAVACSSSAQTADRSAAPPSPAVNAPLAHGGTYAVENGELVVAPGLRIPNGNVPWALDVLGSKQVLVPVHHSALKQVGDATSLAGASSHTALHSSAPVFFIHASDRTENNGDSGRGVPTGWALLPVVADGATRTIQRVKFSDVSAATVCAEPVICTQAEALPGGWLRITPRVPLQPGEYALVPVPRAATSLSPLAYDFVVGADAATSKDVVVPGQNLEVDPRKKKKH